jgi:hypothetical protein
MNLGFYSVTLVSLVLELPNVCVHEVDAEEGVDITSSGQRTR